MKRICMAPGICILLLIFQAPGFSQIYGTAMKASSNSTIKGLVTESGSQESLPGVTVKIKDSRTGTVTDADGRFSLALNELPVTLIFSRVGLKMLEIPVDNEEVLSIEMEEESVLGKEIVISASRIEEEIISSPVTIEKLTLSQIQQSASDDYYKSIGNLKGVDVIQSSINFTTMNARGFMAAVNTRMVQYLDGIDTQLPSLNHAASNLNGPTSLDIESVEFLPGTASALYGPNAFNGVIVQRTKNPFEFQGFSAYGKFGLNHTNGYGDVKETSGRKAPDSPRPMYEAALRFAKAFNNKLAFKLSASYAEARNWHGLQQSDRNAHLQPAGYNFNPGADQIFLSGDEVSASLGLLKLQLAPGLQGSPLEPFLQFLPNQVVARTGYSESSLMDYDTYSAKISGALHYRFNDKLELSYTLNYGKASTIIQAAQRTPIDGFSVQHHKLELQSKNFVFRTYAALPDAGKAYSGDLTGVLINNTWKPHATWFRDYSVGYLTYLASQNSQPGFDPNSTSAQQAAHLAARNAADAGRYLPGTPEFEKAKSEIISSVIPTGSRIKDNTRMYHAEAQYDFSDLVKIVSIQAGTSFRMFDLNSDGTLFADTPGNDISVKEYGAYAQATKTFLNDRLKFTGSLRYDKNENFDAQFNPRLSVVFSPVENHYLRMGYQTGFRNPTLQAQHVDFNAVSQRLLGGLPQYAAAHNAYENAFLLSSVQQFAAAVAQAGNAVAPGSPAILDLLVPVTPFDAVKPEEVRSVEAGYKMLVANNLLIDVSYYYNRYNDFIAQRAIRKASAPVDLEATAFSQANALAASSLLSPVTTPGSENTFSIYTNVNKQISAQGVSTGLEYSLPMNYRVMANYNWNKLNEELGNGFISEFNTPQHKFNIGVSNPKLIKKLGFNITYRWQQNYLFESTFAKGNVPAFGLTDAQISYTISKIKSIVKVGGSNIFDERYFPNFGAPTIGAIYYVSVTFDPFNIK